MQTYLIRAAAAYLLRRSSTAYSAAVLYSPAQNLPVLSAPAFAVPLPFRSMPQILNACPQTLNVRQAGRKAVLQRAAR